MNEEEWRRIRKNPLAIFDRYIQPLTERCPVEGCKELPEDHHHPRPAIEDENRLTAAIHWHYCGGEMPPPGSTTALGMCGYSDAHRALARSLIALLPPTDADPR